MTITITDEQLVAQYLQGDEGALEILIQRYLPLVYGFSRQYSGDPDTAADITQETLIKVWKNLKKFDTNKKFKSWLFTIAKNTALDWLKRRDATPFSALGDKDSLSEGLEDTISSPYDDAIAHEAASHSQLLLLKVSSIYREVIALRHFHDLTFREIAEHIDEPLNTVKSRYRRALLVAKKVLAKSDFS